MGVNIQTQIIGKKRLDRLLDSIEKNIKTYKPVWPDVSKYVFNVFNRQFSTQGSSGKSGAWRPLSPKYAAWKEKNYPGRPILVQRGQLKRSMVKKGAADNIYRETKNILVMGTQNKLGRIHQDGTRRMPARKIIDLTAEQFNKIGKIVWDYTKGLLKGKKI